MVDNRPGGGGAVGMGQVLRSPPNGRTLVIVTTSSVPIARALHRNLPYDPLRDFSLVGITSSALSALVVRGGDPFRTVDDLVAFSKRSGKPPVAYFSPGNGTSQHLAAVLFSQLAEAAMDHVPYRGVSDAITGLLTGDTTFGFASIPAVSGFLSSGELRALGTTGPKQASALPSVPTLASIGYPAFTDIFIWFGIAVPRTVLDPIKAVLRDVLSTLMQDAALGAQLQNAGFDPVPAMDAAAAESLVSRQTAFWADLVRRSGATID